MERCVLDYSLLETIHVGNTLIRQLKRRNDVLLCFADTRQLLEQVEALDRPVPAGSSVWIVLGYDRRGLQS